MLKRYTQLKVLAVAALLLGVAVAADALRGEPAADQDKKASTDTTEHKHIDPVAVNGPIFVGWPKPNVALVFSGEQNGYLEPCGCAGLENQKGGLKRRFTFIKQLRDKGWNVVPMDLGGQEVRTGVQAELKVDFTLRALIKMGYAAVGIGPGDLRIDLLQIAINLDPATNPLVSANVGIGDFNSGLTKLYKIVEVGGMKIGITSILGKKTIAARKMAGDLTLLEPYQAIPRILAVLRNQGCDHLVLLSNAEPDETKDLARRFPEFDWVMTAHGAEEPPKEPGKIQGVNSHLVEVGQKAEYVVVVGLYKNGDTPFRYQRVPLDHRFADAPEMQRMQVEYQHQLQTLGLQGLGLKPVPYPSGRKFAGSKACADCHTRATEVFEKTPHAHATETLVKLNPPRQFDPECLSCHVTGWDAQKFFPYESGYLGLKQTPDLVGNGCENCHGPAARHVAAESGEIEVTDAEKEKLRAALRLKILPNEGNKTGQVYKDGSVVDLCM
ncbi:MAG TPA: multiheme c-type cytochrome, partial [Lacipirellulaceae bacterium]|nr:multiheme c-type cytochrome [Lacipirellulaceae bacterium]